MSTAIQRRRGTTAQHSSFAGLAGELTVDTDKKTVVVHDGTTAGGVPLAKDSAVVHNTGAETVAGVKTLSSNPVFDAGTANGVLYLNGSKVATSGSALTFDGTTFTINGGTIGTRLAVKGTGAFGGFDTGAATDGRIEYAYNGTNIFYTGIDSSSLMTLMARSGVSLAFGANASEGMRLTSTGLGIGTSSPNKGSWSKALTLEGASNEAYELVTNGTYMGWFAAGGSSVTIGTKQANPFIFFTSDTERMRLDSSGNLGLGVTPSSSWPAVNGPALQIGAFASVFNNSSLGSSEVAYNTIRSGSDAYVYNITGIAASRFQQRDGTFRFFTAPSGTAGAAITFTQAMTLDASGLLQVGLTGNTGGGRVDVLSNATSAYTARSASSGVSTTVKAVRSVSSDASNFANAQYDALSHAWILSNSTQAMTLDSSGNLLVGTTSALISADYRLSVSGVRGGEFKSTGGATAPTNTIWNNATTGDNLFESFRTETSDTQRGTISYNRSAGLVAYNTTSDYRAKDIFGPVTDSGTVIDSVPVYMGKMKGATQERPMFLAHETPAYAHTGEKDAVDENGNPVYQQMDASALIPVMWAELQSLRARVAQLESN